MVSGSLLVVVHSVHHWSYTLIIKNRQLEEIRTHNGPMTHWELAQSWSMAAFPRWITNRLSEPLVPAPTNHSSLLSIAKPPLWFWANQSSLVAAIEAPIFQQSTSGLGNSRMLWIDVQEQCRWQHCGLVGIQKKSSVDVGLPVSSMVENSIWLVAS